MSGHNLSGLSSGFFIRDSFVGFYTIPCSFEKREVEAPPPHVNPLGRQRQYGYQGNANNGVLHTHTSRHTQTHSDTFKMAAMERRVDANSLISITALAWRWVWVASIASTGVVYRPIDNSTRPGSFTPKMLAFRFSIRVFRIVLSGFLTDSLIFLTSTDIPRFFPMSNYFYAVLILI